MGIQQLRPRSEPKTLKFKYLMAQEKIDLQRELQKELNLIEETQSGFNLYLSLFVGAIDVRHGITSAPICGLRHIILISAPSSIGILTSA